MSKLKKENETYLDCPTIYQQDIAGLVRLSLKDEQELNNAIMSGDTDEEKEAREKLVCSHLDYVVAIAKKFAPKLFSANLADLIQAGNMGLMEAATRFDPKKAEAKGVRFTTYAYRWIFKFIVEEYLNNRWFVRVPDSMMRNISWKNKIQRALTQSLHRQPTTAELVTEMANRRDIDYASAFLLLRKIQVAENDAVSLDVPTSVHSKKTLGDSIVDSYRVDDTLEDLFRSQELNNILLTLNAREKRVLELRFGVGIGISLTLEEIGREFNISRERVRQLEAIAIRKLRHPSRSRKLRYQRI